MRRSILSPVVRLAVAAVLGGAGPAAAQAPCDAAVALGDSLYRSGQYEAVEGGLGVCFQGADAGVPVAAFRLRTLALVRAERLAEAQRMMLRLLAVRPAYVPDEVLDPPVYVAFVALVRQQAPRPSGLPAADTVSARAPAPPSEPVPQPVPQPVPILEARPQPPAPSAPAAGDQATGQTPRRPTGAVSVAVAAQMESYDGERRRVGGGAAVGFVRNGGGGLAATVAVQAVRRVAVGLRVGTFRLPPLIRDCLADADSGYPLGPGEALGAPVTGYPTLTAATTSRWVSSVALSVRLDALPDARVTPYVRAGGRLLVRRVDGRTRVGAGPEAALGVEALVRPRLAVFGDVAGTLVAPDAALDAATFRRNGDLLLAVSVGLRVQASGPFPP